MNDTFSTPTHLPSHAEIAGAAYRLYLDEGRPEGRDWDHWFRAEEALRGTAAPASSDGAAGADVAVSRLVAEGGLVLRSDPAGRRSNPGSPPKRDGGLVQDREGIRRQASAIPHAPRQSHRSEARREPAR